MKISGPAPRAEIPLVAPGREEADVEAELARLPHDEVHVIPVVVVSPVLDVWSGGVVVEKRAVAVWVGVVQTVELGERDRLDDGESPLGAVAQIPIGFLAVQPVEQLPCRVAEPEERLLAARAALADQKSLVLRNFQRR